MIPSDAREHPTYKGYWITPSGEVWSTKRGAPYLKKPRKNIDGYPIVGIKRYPRKIHRLVAETFIPNPHNLPVVNHINGVKTDNSVSNLEWCTVGDNNRHSVEVLGNCNGPKPKTYLLLEHSTGRQFVVTNLRQFCKKNNLTPQSIFKTFGVDYGRRTPRVPYQLLKKISD